MSQRGTITSTSSNGDNVSQELLKSKKIDAPSNIKQYESDVPSNKGDTALKWGIYIYRHVTNYYQRL